jgi:DNA-binding SARP family transcriptional activator
MPSERSGAGGDVAGLHVRLLGVVEVALDGERLRAFDTLRLQRFLALLVLRPELLHRSRLAFELWPDSDEGQARTNLRKLLHDFRHALPDNEAFVEIGKEVIRWIPDGSSTVDVEGFRAAMAAGDLELAVAHYSGDLLPACYDDWVLDARARLRAEAHAAFRRLAEQAVTAADHDATIDYSERAIDIEPADEAAVRLRMEANIELGQRAAALRCYHRYTEVLERDLGVVPSEAIEGLYRQLRSGSISGDDDQGDANVQVAESSFVGRDREQVLVHDAWVRVRETGAHLVLLTGEPGIGKSRLAEELGRRVRADGYQVAAARAYEAAGRLPWGPVVDLLRSDALRSQVETLDPIWRTELARLLPELVDTAAPGRPAQSGELAQRRRLFDAVSRAIVADDRPRVLIIDDLQWCDAETVELIGFVIRAGASAPLLIVGTLRSEEIPTTHPVNALVDALARDQAVTTVPLDALDAPTTAALAARLGATDTVDPALAARLWTETEGNPLFIIEALRAGIPEEGRAVLTPTIRALLRARLGQLPDEARRLAEVAAVIGRPFSVGLVASATGIGEQQVVDRIDDLWRRRIVRDQGHTYDFSHDKLRAVALEMVSPARRRQLHRNIAEAIAVEFDDLAAAPQLAAHYDQAGMVEQAIVAYRAAGARAAAVSALEDAVAMFRRALSLLADVSASGDRDELELDIRLALGSPLVALEGYGSSASHRLYERAFSLCRKLGRPAAPPILRGLGLARLQGCRFDDASDMGRALVDHDRGDPVTRTEGRYLLGVSAFWRGDLQQAHKHLESAIVSYDLSSRDEHLALYAQDPKAVCLVRLGWAELWAGDPGRADEVVRSALELATDLDHLMTLWYVLTYAAITAAESEDLTRLADLLEQTELLGGRLPMPYLMIVGHALRGWLEVNRGSPDGIEEIERAVSHSRTEGESLHLTYTLLLLARAYGMVGDPDRGRAAAREGLSWSNEHDQRYLDAELWKVDGELALAAGKLAAAEASLRTAVDIAAAHGAGWLELRALASLARLDPDHGILERLAARRDATPSGHELPTYREATALVTRSAR